MTSDLEISLPTFFFVNKLSSIAVLVCSIFGWFGNLLIIWATILAYESASDNMTMCLIPEAITLPAAKLWFMSDGIINIGVTIIYVVLMVSVKVYTLG
ncbi:hypothetical protein QR680_015289 [Steinernema hermaphroditum]|uniref:G-protein coupled receptors family 1 profile domain-containing protein n=1 Tax=Steinernema hermaphroditum TaxID=289476 RepID=A0AA39H933_9BILA|nr:hypothetical protein QR680_015289 [Steinernema hermaphroditum]